MAVFEGVAYTTSLATNCLVTHLTYNTEDSEHYISSVAQNAFNSAVRRGIQRHSSRGERYNRTMETEGRSAGTECQGLAGFYGVYHTGAVVVAHPLKQSQGGSVGVSDCVCWESMGRSDQLVCQIVFVGKVVVEVTSWCERDCVCWESSGRSDQLA